MKRRLALSLLPLSLLTLGFGQCSKRPVQIWQVNRSIPGYVEPNTPGAPGVSIPAKIAALLGEDANLNRVSYVKTFPVTLKRPRTIVIFIPGFLGGATTFDPLARDLVAAGNERLQVWSVDRRPNQLEDQLGGLHAEQALETGDPTAIFEGAQFYFPDTDLPPVDNFPGPEDLDINLDGVLDPQLPLVDDMGVERLPILFEQDDVRFLGSWGIDLYMRDWKRLVEKARRVVGRNGLVVLGGHSQGTGWASIFAAYDFDPGPGVEAGYELIDGLILLEGGGVRPSSNPPPTAAEYVQQVADLTTPGGPDVFLQDLILGGIPVLSLTDLGTIGQVASIAAVADPDAPAVIQRTPVLGLGLIGVLLRAPATNLTVAGLFLDDDFSPNPAFRATIGFSDNGPNLFGVFGPVYWAFPDPGGALRSWKNFDDPTLPVCPPSTPGDGTGCAINLTTDPGDREVSDINTFLRTQYEVNNGFEWYFLSGRVSLDFSYGNDSSSLGDESLLAITQNANVDIPVLGIGGTNGLARSEASFDTYFGSIATPAGDKKAVILPGYAHVDPLVADQNEALPLILDFMDQIRSGASPVFP